jgi:hypothetical protein
LNRSFVLKTSDFQQQNQDYAKINDFLNPTTPATSGLFTKFSFYIQSLYLIYNHSIETLRRSILKGQYSFPKGLYFGGNQYQPEFEAVKKIWDEQIQGYEKVVYIDLHTGYGEKGKLHLLAGHSISEVSKKLEEMFAPSTIDFGNSKNFYETTGDALSYFQQNYKKEADIFPITFEFGTLNSQSTLGSLDSLYRMVAENQSFHYKAKDDDSQKAIKKMFREMFYPSDFEWRDGVLAQTKTEMDKIVQRLETDGK